MKPEPCPTPERIARIREICASALPGSGMHSEGRELLAYIDELEGVMRNFAAKVDGDGGHAQIARNETPLEAFRRTAYEIIARADLLGCHEG